MRKIAIVNQKGGVAKTTTAMNLGAGLADAGKKVCLIDLDPQSNLSKGLGVWQPDILTVYDLMRGKASPEETVITRSTNFHILPAGLNMSVADLELGGEFGREKKLDNALKSLTNYDYVLIDCPPALNLLTINALVYAKEVFIPIEAEYFALEGTDQLAKTIALVKANLNHSITISGVIITKYNSSRNLTKEVEKRIREYFKNKVFNTVIRVCVSLAEAPAEGKTIFEYDPKSNGAVDYNNVCKEIIERK